MSTAVDNAYLQLRAGLLGQVRQFFRDRPALEVQTPLANSRATTAVDLDSLAVGRGWLRTSPEHWMKRLIAGGSGDIWQLGPCFRAAERGRLHHPEFQMLEWYRLGGTLASLAEETRVLLDLLLDRPADADRWIQTDYRELFVRHWNLDPLRAPAAEVRDLALSEGAPQFDTADAVPWRDYLLDRTLQMHYADKSLLVRRFPADQAELAATQVTDDGPVALRFEIWVQGVELANGAVELRDAAEAQRRMHLDNEIRRQRGKPVLQPDESLIEVLAAGLPECAGVALGFDRVLMLAAGADRLDQVLTGAVEGDCLTG